MTDNPETTTDQKIDKVLTHPIWGLFSFIFIVWFLFYCTFTLGSYPQAWIENGMQHLIIIIKGNLQNNWIREFLCNGLVMGLGSVLAFLPNILILFFFISLMQETEYLPRAATIMDKYMHRIGLHGSSFIPLLMGFGCNVPAIMATRTIERKSDRILTMMMIPYIPCSARIPTFLLLCGIFFHENQVMAMLLLYLGGIIIGIVVALIFKRVLFNKISEDYVIELPPYRRPSFKLVTNSMLSAAWQYLKKIGTVVLLAVIIVWVLDYFPLKEKRAPLERSYLEQMGETVEPIMRPLGFDWKMSVSLITGITAKEFIVSTLGVVFQADEGKAHNKASLVERIKSEGTFNKSNALSFMIFALLYMPCVATAITIKKESGKWKWALLSMASTLIVAWICSFSAFKAGMMIWG
jgi:ferrous iron transport protein B